MNQFNDLKLFDNSQEVFIDEDDEDLLIDISQIRNMQHGVRICFFIT